MHHNKFTIVRIYKVIGDVVFVFQRNSAEMWINELHLNHVNSITTTYMKIIKPIHKILLDNYTITCRIMK